MIRRYDAFDVDVPAHDFYPVGPITGGTGALSTSDGYTSFVGVTHDGFPGSPPTSHTFRFANALPIPPGAVVKVEADWASDARFDLASVIYVSASTPEFGPRTMATFSRASGAPGAHFGEPEQFTVPGVYVTGFPEYFDGTATWEVYSGTNEAHVLTAQDITRLTLIVETPTVPPMQLIQRNDGLGMGTKRLFNPGTRQTTGRPLGKY